jgi:hypothetical protein
LFINKSVLVCLLNTGNDAFAQQNNQTQNKNSTEFCYYEASSLFVLANMFPDLPGYHQLNLRYQRPTSGDAIFKEAITLTCDGSQGRPYGSDYDDKSLNFPGKIKVFGVGLAFQLYLEKSICPNLYNCNALRL